MEQFISLLDTKLSSDVSNICRTCLQRNENLFPIFIAEDSLHNRLFDLTQLKILQDDRLPSSICCNCLEKAEEAFKYRNQVIAVDILLKEFLIGTETPDVLDLSSNRDSVENDIFYVKDEETNVINNETEANDKIENSILLESEDILPKNEDNQELRIIHFIEIDDSDDDEKSVIILLDDNEDEKYDLNENVNESANLELPKEVKDVGSVDIQQKIDFKSIEKLINRKQLTSEIKEKDTPISSTSETLSKDKHHLTACDTNETSIDKQNVIPTNNQHTKEVISGNLCGGESIKPARSVKPLCQTHLFNSNEKTPNSNKSAPGDINESSLNAKSHVNADPQPSQNVADNKSTETEPAKLPSFSIEKLLSYNEESLSNRKLRIFTFGAKSIIDFKKLTSTCDNKKPLNANQNENSQSNEAVVNKNSISANQYGELSSTNIQSEVNNKQSASTVNTLVTKPSEELSLNSGVRSMDSALLRSLLASKLEEYSANKHAAKPFNVKSLLNVANVTPVSKENLVFNLQSTRQTTANNKQYEFNSKETPFPANNKYGFIYSGESASAFTEFNHNNENAVKYNEKSTTNAYDNIGTKQISYNKQNVSKQLSSLNFEQPLNSELLTANSKQYTNTQGDKFIAAYDKKSLQQKPIVFYSKKTAIYKPVPIKKPTSDFIQSGDLNKMLNIRKTYDFINRLSEQRGNMLEKSSYLGPFSNQRDVSYSKFQNVNYNPSKQYVNYCNMNFQPKSSIIEKAPTINETPSRNSNFIRDKQRELIYNDKLPSNNVQYERLRQQQYSIPFGNKSSVFDCNQSNYNLETISNNNQSIYNIEKRNPSNSIPYNYTPIKQVMNNGPLKLTNSNNPSENYSKEVPTSQNESNLILNQKPSDFFNNENIPSILEYSKNIFSNYSNSLHIPKEIISNIQQSTTLNPQVSKSNEINITPVEKSFSNMPQPTTFNPQVSKSNETNITPVEKSFSNLPQPTTFNPQESKSNKSDIAPVEKSFLNMPQPTTFNTQVSKSNKSDIAPVEKSFLNMPQPTTFNPQVSKSNKSNIPSAEKSFSNLPQPTTFNPQVSKSDKSNIALVEKSFSNLLQPTTFNPQVFKSNETDSQISFSNMPLVYGYDQSNIVDCRQQFDKNHFSSNVTETCNNLSSSNYLYSSNYCENDLPNDEPLNLTRENYNNTTSNLEPRSDSVPLDLTIRQDVPYNYEQRNDEQTDINWKVSMLDNEEPTFMYPDQTLNCEPLNLTVDTSHFASEQYKSVDSERIHRQHEPYNSVQSTMNYDQSNITYNNNENANSSPGYDLDSEFNDTSYIKTNTEVTIEKSTMNCNQNKFDNQEFQSCDVELRCKENENNFSKTQNSLENVNLEKNKTLIESNSAENVPISCKKKWLSKYKSLEITKDQQSISHIVQNTPSAKENLKITSINKTSTSVDGGKLEPKECLSEIKSYLQPPPKSNDINKSITKPQAVRSSNIKKHLDQTPLSELNKTTSITNNKPLPKLMKISNTSVKELLKNKKIIQIPQRVSLNNEKSARIEQQNYTDLMEMNPKTIKTYSKTTKVKSIPNQEQSVHTISDYDKEVFELSKACAKSTTKKTVLNKKSPKYKTTTFNSCGNISIVSEISLPMGDNSLLKNKRTNKYETDLNDLTTFENNSKSSSAKKKNPPSARSKKVAKAKKELKSKTKKLAPYSKTIDDSKKVLGKDYKLTLSNEQLPLDSNKFQYSKISHNTKNKETSEKLSSVYQKGTTTDVLTLNDSDHKTTIYNSSENKSLLLPINDHSLSKNKQLNKSKTDLNDKKTFKNSSKSCSVKSKCSTSARLKILADAKKKFKTASSKSLGLDSRIFNNLKKTAVKDNELTFSNIQSPLNLNKLQSFQVSRDTKKQEGPEKQSSMYQKVTTLDSVSCENKSFVFKAPLPINVHSISENELNKRASNFNDITTFGNSNISSSDKNASSAKKELKTMAPKKFIPDLKTFGNLKKTTVDSKPTLINEQLSLNSNKLQPDEQSSVYSIILNDNEHKTTAYNNCENQSFLFKPSLPINDHSLFKTKQLKKTEVNLNDIITFEKSDKSCSTKNQNSLPARLKTWAEIKKESNDLKKNTAKVTTLSISNEQSSLNSNKLQSLQMSDNTKNQKEPLKQSTLYQRVVTADSITLNDSEHKTTAYNSCENKSVLFKAPFPVFKNEQLNKSESNMNDIMMYGNISTSRSACNTSHARVKMVAEALEKLKSISPRRSISNSKTFNNSKKITVDNKSTFSNEQLSLNSDKSQSSHSTKNQEESEKRDSLSVPFEIATGIAKKIKSDSPEKLDLDSKTLNDSKMTTIKDNNLSVFGEQSLYSNKSKLIQVPHNTENQQAPEQTSAVYQNVTTIDSVTLNDVECKKTALSSCKNMSFVSETSLPINNHLSSENNKLNNSKFNLNNTITLEKSSERCSTENKNTLPVVPKVVAGSKKELKTATVKNKLTVSNEQSSLDSNKVQSFQDSYDTKYQETLNWEKPSLIYKKVTTTNPITLNNNEISSNNIESITRNPISKIENNHLSNITCKISETSHSTFSLQVDKSNVSNNEELTSISEHNISKSIPIYDQNLASSYEELVSICCNDALSDHEQEIPQGDKGSKNIEQTLKKNDKPIMVKNDSDKQPTLSYNHNDIINLNPTVSNCNENFPLNLDQLNRKRTQKTEQKSEDELKSYFNQFMPSNCENFVTYQGKSMPSLEDESTSVEPVICNNEPNEMHQQYNAICIDNSQNQSQILINQGQLAYQNQLLPTLEQPPYIGFYVLLCNPPTDNQIALSYNERFNMQYNNQLLINANENLIKTYDQSMIVSNNNIQSKDILETNEESKENSINNELIEQQSTTIDGDNKLTEDKNIQTVDIYDEDSLTQQSLLISNVNSEEDVVPEKSTLNETVSNKQEVCDTNLDEIETTSPSADMKEFGDFEQKFQDEMFVGEIQNEFDSSEQQTPDEIFINQFQNDGIIIFSDDETVSLVSDNISYTDEPEFSEMKDINSPEPLCSVNAKPVDNNNKKSFKCKYCKKKFKMKTSLMKHKKSHHTGRKLKSKSEKDTSLMKKRKNMKEKFYQIEICPLCSKKFETKILFTNHMKIQHNMKKPYECNYCNHKVKHKIEIEIHIQQKHKIMLKCNKCSETFWDEKALIQHNKTHVFICDVCRKVCVTRRRLLLHLRIHNRGKKLHCPQCSSTFVGISQLHRHIKLMHTGEEHVCTVCKKVFTHRARLESHLVSHRDDAEKELKCNFCSKKFNYKHHLLSHEKVHTKAKPFTCSKCGKDFLQECDLTIHLNQHDENLPFECNKCNKKFPNSLILGRHFVRHTDNKPFKCDICEKRFKTSLVLRKHLTKHKKATPCNLEVTFTDDTQKNVNIKVVESEIDRHICGLCDAELPTLKELEIHMKLHITKYKCKLCSRQFKLASLLEEHVKKHSVEKRDYICNFCGTSFFRSFHLNAHIKSKHLNKLHECTFCPSSFYTIKSLRIHLQRHTGEKNYECTVCNKKFVTSSCLTTHMRVHSGKKPYTCKVCSRSFTTTSILTRHMNTHSTNDRYKMEMNALEGANREIDSKLSKKPRNKVVNVEQTEYSSVMNCSSDFTSGDNSQNTDTPQIIFIDQSKTHLPNSNNEGDNNFNDLGITILNPGDIAGNVKNSYSDPPVIQIIDNNPAGENGNDENLISSQESQPGTSYETVDNNTNVLYIL